jgi:hypothetical protein
MDRRELLGALLASSAALLVPPQTAFAQVAAKAPAPPKPAKPKGPPSSYPLDSFGPRPTDNVALRWNEQGLSAIRAVKPGPTVVARALAVLQTCVFDAWAAYDPVAVGTRLGGGLRRPAEEHTLAYKSAAVSYAAHRALVDLFPTRKADFDALLSEMGYDPALTGSTDVTSPQGIGTVAANAVLGFRHEDGANQLGGYRDTSGYVPVNTPDTVVNRMRWQPLRFSDGAGGTLVQTYSTPHWGSVVPFALTRPDQFPLPGPTLKKVEEYKKAIKALVDETASLDDRMKVVAEYWADGPASELPAGHWNVFAQAVSRMRGHTLDQDVRLLFALDNAMLDASIAAWHAKRRWDFVRPITAIREECRGKTIKGWRGPYLGIGQILGETWRPYQPDTFPTPPFPDYVSGHSTFSAAAAQVLRTFTGSDALNVAITVRAGTGRLEPGSVPSSDVRLSWASYTAAASEAGMSRRWGGIHFNDADLHARTMGRSIGTNAYTRAQAYINGTA